MKKTFVLAVLIFTVLITPLPSNAAEQDKYVYDLAGILTETEINEIESAAKNYFSGSYASVYIVTDPSGNVSYYGEDFIEEYPEAGKNSIILIITDNSRHNYNLYTYGKCNRLISNSEVDMILDDPEVYNNIKINNDYAAASVRFLELSSEACKPEYLKAILLGVFVGLAASVITGVCIVYSYGRKMRSEKYPLGQFAKLDLTRKEDFFTGSFVTKQTIHKSSGSGRSGSRGGGGGGGRGHRGGR